MTSNNEDSFNSITSISELRKIVQQARLSGKKIGVVPTMGALHAGHLSLIQEALARTDIVVVTLFVNPTQFSPDEDFGNYPRPVEEDLKKCKEAGAHLVFHPDVSEIYPEDAYTTVSVNTISEKLEGQFRPTHFDGVTTVVMKLFNIVLPDVAFFGQKDYQQQLLIKRMVKDLNVPVEVIACPTIRDPDGLAMSSRNQYLSKQERETALLVPESLKLAEKMLLDGEEDFDKIKDAMKKLLTSSDEVKVDYVSLAHPETLEELKQVQPEIVALVATYVGSTRLIDNRIIHLSSISSNQ